MTSLSQKSINNSLTRSNSAEIAGYAMPSDIYEDLTPVPNGTLLVTAPANGYVYVYGTIVSAGNVGLSSTPNSVDQFPHDRTKSKLWVYDTRSSANQEACVYLPVAKNDNVWFLAANFSTSVCRFVYAEGEL